jgi:peptidoglycan/LPS O-acetylase OafA/YrhL
MNFRGMARQSAARYLHPLSFALRLPTLSRSTPTVAQAAKNTTVEDAHNINAIPRTTNSAAFYRPELDSLRFFAFFAVFITHTLPSVPQFYSAHHFPRVAGELLQSISRAGAYGVDLFFLLSSYLITELLLREKDATGRLDVLAFYKRRILRIWPLYFTFIGIAWALTLVDRTQQLSVSYVAAFLLLAGNWISAINGNPQSVIAPLWSVSVEEQFYLLWPLLVRKARISALATSALAMLAASSIFRYIFFLAGWTDLRKNTLTRLEPMALGILIAVALRLRVLRQLSAVGRTVALAAGTACWLLVAEFSNLDFSQLGTMLGYPLIAIGAAAIFLWCVGNSAPFLRSPTLVYLGKISYGLYVFHMLGIRIGIAILGGFTSRFSGFIAYWLFALIATIVMASISYFALERPFLRLKSRYTVVQSRSS